MRLSDALTQTQHNNKPQQQTAFTGDTMQPPDLTIKQSLSILSTQWPGMALSQFIWFETLGDTCTLPTEDASSISAQASGMLGLSSVTMCWMWLSTCRSTSINTGGFMGTKVLRLKSGPIWFSSDSKTWTPPLTNPRSSRSLIEAALQFPV